MSNILPSGDSGFRDYDQTRVDIVDHSISGVLYTEGFSETESINGIFSSVRPPKSGSVFYFKSVFDPYIHYYPKKVNANLSLYETRTKEEPFYIDYFSYFKNSEFVNPYDNSVYSYDVDQEGFDNTLVPPK